MVAFDFSPFFTPLLTHDNLVYFAYNLSEQQPEYVSAAYEQLIGDPLSHLADDLPHLLARVHPADWQHLRQQLALLPPGTLVQDVELRLARPQAPAQRLCVSVCQAPQPSGATYLVGTVRDVSAAHAASPPAQLLHDQQNSTLQLLAHDLATPLVVLQQLAEQLAVELAPPSPAVHELLQLMRTTCAQGSTLIHDLVESEFLASANAGLQLERTDLAGWLAQLMAEYQRTQAHVPLQLVWEAPSAPVHAQVDAPKLQQVISNLLSNAGKFTPDGGSVRLALQQRGAAVLITIADTGIGIPAHLQAGLFEKFTKARRPGLRGEKTTGLGMSIIRTIVELHHGRIWVESQEGHGTTFFVELPAAPAA